jgi:hypothetical protein
MRFRAMAQSGLLPTVTVGEKPGNGTRATDLCSVQTGAW